jgi:hypothetical protein
LQNLPNAICNGCLYSPTLYESAHATHAWVDIYLDGRGWVSLDPTHDILQSKDLVRVAIRCDYTDGHPHARPVHRYRQRRAQRQSAHPAGLSREIIPNQAIKKALTSFPRRKGFLSKTTFAVSL